MFELSHNRKLKENKVVLVLKTLDQKGLELVIGRKHLSGYTMKKEGEGKTKAGLCFPWGLTGH